MKLEIKVVIIEFDNDTIEHITKSEGNVKYWSNKLITLRT